MLIRDITEYLESVAPLQHQEHYDNAGLITGDPIWKATGAIICLDSTEKVIDEAIEKDCNLVIAHHPIVFTGLKKITGAKYMERVIIKAIKHDIAIYAIHTNLDNVLDRGVNQKIAQTIGLINLQILDPKADLSIGSGIIGDLTNALTFEEFVNLLKEKMQTSVIRCTDFIGSDVKKVALCGGSGRFLLPHAISQNADVFVSADFKYHDFFDANDQITIMDIGHYESEQFTIELLYNIITGKFAKFAAYCTSVDTNPINYL